MPPGAAAGAAQAASAAADGSNEPFWTPRRIARGVVSTVICLGPIFLASGTLLAWPQLW